MGRENKHRLSPPIPTIKLMIAHQSLPAVTASGVLAFCLFVMTLTMTVTLTVTMTMTVTLTMTMTVTVTVN